jgi:hypothetical protein
MRRRHAVLGVVLAALVAALALPATASAVRLMRVASGFDALAQVTAPRRGDVRGALYFVEQDGQIYRRAGGTRSLFLNLGSRVQSGGEEGLLSMAFDPRYASNRLFYVYYTNNNGNIRVARFKANAPSTRGLGRTGRIILKVGHPGESNHNGGQLAFGPNGRLYAGTGDGGGGCDPGGNAQDLGSRLGKFLSINPRNLAAGWRIEGYGLRNPWRFSFDRANGRLYIGDVGQNAWEEIDTRHAAALGGERENYGWDVYEARANSRNSSGCGHGPLNPNGRRVWPISRYGHGSGRCSITGGFVYRGMAIDWLRGFYVFGDYCTGEVWRIKVGRRGNLVLGRRLLRNTALNISSFGESRGGELYVVHHGGTVYRLVRS